MSIFPDYKNVRVDGQSSWYCLFSVYGGATVQRGLQIRTVRSYTISQFSPMTRSSHLLVFSIVLHLAVTGIADKVFEI